MPGARATGRLTKNPIIKVKIPEARAVEKNEALAEMPVTPRMMPFRARM
jgi:hypothetical protein